MKRTIEKSAVGALALLALGACSKHVMPTPSAEEARASGMEVPGPIPAPFGTMMDHLELDPRISAACQLSSSDVFFAVDSADLTPEDKDLLARVATCIKTGAAGDGALSIVGRADPSGSDEHNKDLGMRRAESVVSYLEQQGIQSGRVQLRSEGEAGASDDQSQWARDRRVTIAPAE